MLERAGAAQAKVKKDLPVRSMTCHATAASLVEIDGVCRSVGSQTLAVSLICRGAGFEGPGSVGTVTVCAWLGWSCARVVKAFRAVLDHG